MVKLFITNLKNTIKSELSYKVSFILAFVSYIFIFFSYYFIILALFSKFNKLAEKFKEKINFKEGSGYERE